MVRQDVLLRYIPIRRNLTWIHVLIWASPSLAQALSRTLEIETVHRAVVVRFVEAAPRMAKIARLCQMNYLQVYLLVALRGLDFSRRRAVGAGKGREEIIEAAILFDKYNDVLDGL
jgi:hypothetical protein